MPTAPPSRCTDPECHEIATHRGRCDEHKPIAWAGRDDKARRYGISSGTWRSLKTRVARRDRGCCYICGAEPPDDPDEPGHELDHILPIGEGGAADDLDNLGLACTTCHAAKSAEEALRANAARHERRRAARHPG
jgi:5-methylcytosine-specific restriction protein A